MKLTAWGRYPDFDATGENFESIGRLRDLVGKDRPCIVHAMGRSYGDSALNDHVLFSSRFDKFSAFDNKEGILTCESGVTLKEIVDTFLPKGWFLPVTPGTQFVSVGGAIASDVHGKNHHWSGCFSNFVSNFDLMLPDGSIVTCSRDQNSALFHATCGGMGLTGPIVLASIKLIRVSSEFIDETVVPCNDLEAIFDAMERHSSATYSVAWIDCLETGKSLGRSILYVGKHSETARNRSAAKHPLSVPFDFPGFCLNRYSVSLFNKLYFYSQTTGDLTRQVPLRKFFYPLDGVLNWNRIYGRRGFLQYQFVLPKKESFQGLKKILNLISEAGEGSFLAVLKLFGPENDNMLSFPLEGYTMALDFSIHSGIFPLLHRLDHIVADCGGRLYLAKDARMPKEIFQGGYSKIDEFESVRSSYGMDGKYRSLQSIRLGV